MKMELGPLSAHGESGRASNRVGQQTLSQQEAQARNATTPDTSKYRRIPLGTTHNGERMPAAGGALVTTTAMPTSAKSKIHPSPAGQSNPLLPVTERGSYGERLAGNKSKTEDHDDGKAKWNMTPDGGSAGREGRQFAVWNVGNNGRIYLRPSVRPAHQRFPQPQFVFPLTPPGTTAGVNVLAPTTDQREVKQHEDASLLLAENQLTPSYLSTPVTSYLGVKKKSLSGARHRRAMSDTTVPDSNIIAQEQDPGGFKIVITQPGDEHRPKTVDAFDPNKGSLLEVSIPSWKLGTPRFSIRGTPFLRGSSYAPTEDIRHSSTSILNHTPRELTPRQSRYNQVTRADSDHLDPHSVRTVMTAQLPPLRSTFLSPRTGIEPTTFDALTFKPACDDRSIVRYSPNTRTVTAATPPRLVAEITSPSFLDYDLISDFFLTFRTFLDCADLIRMLIARLRWAFAQPDKEIGTVVRVRTFVAVRHWILNYFSEDFVANPDLRITFCDLVNELMEELSSKPHSNKAWIKILVEIKRCWRGACAQYWDGPEHEPTAGPYEPIHPGGIPGQRNSKLDPSLRDKVEAYPPRLDDMVLPHEGDDSGFLADFSRAAHIDSVIKDDRPATPEAATADEEVDRDQASPLSIASLDVISCSFPTKNLRSAAKGVQPPLATHPVEPSSVYATDHDPVATTPRSLMGKRVRTAHSQHKRNGSLSDSLREQGMSTTTAQPMVYKNAEFLLKMPYGGNLVRGNILPPGQAFVEVAAAGSNVILSRETTMVDQSPTDSHKLKLPASAMSGRGMKRLLGSVRRALSTRVDLSPSTQGSFFNIPSIGPRGATTNRLPGTAIVPQAQPPPMAGIRPLVRIDLLAAEIAEDFKKAVREDAAEAEKQKASTTTTLPDSPEESPLYSAAHMGGESALRHVSDMAITTGSQSIVIVDDTIPAGFPAMSGAIPASNASVEAFAESFIPNLADPTPPNTPPDPSTDTPRGSSYILSQQSVQPSPDSDPLPPFVSDLETLGRVQSSVVRPSQDITRSSMDYVHQSPHRPPLSGRRGHLRHPSSRSHRSIRSLHRPRYASFTSGITPQATIRSIRSFDATTCSAGSVIDGMSDVPIPQPLRVLRRRPGGDLRAITKTGGLDPGSLRRSRSVGSLSTFTDSIRGSYIHTGRPASSICAGEAIGSEDSPGNANVFSLGAIAEQHPKRQLSLFSTHSSKPVMRPSFEAEAQKLAQIPDDIDDDGGVESALLKLEGKFEKKTPKLPVSMQFEGPPKPARESVGSVQPQPDDLPVSREERLEHRHVQVEDDHIIRAPAPGSDGDAETNFLSVPDAGKAEEEGQSFLSDDSRTSYTSTPLLDRGLTEDTVSRKTLTAEWTNRSIYQGPEEEDGLILAESIGLDSQHPSYDFVKKSESMEKIAPSEALPAIMDPRQSTEVSFLDVDTDDDTDLSSEMSLEFLASNDDDDIFPALKSSPLDAALPLNPLEADPTGSEAGLASHEELSSPCGVKSYAPEMGPPSTTVDPSNSNKIPIVHEHQLWGEKPLPPTPDTTPTTGYLPHSRSFGSSDPTGTREALRHAPTLDIPDPVPQHTKTLESKYSVHLPFILAFESDVLAQQFTLVEKDALAEIDWKDLIDMKWKNAEQTGTNTRSWVSFLRDTDARGVEVVIARFNIMVKWAVSEIVLTQDLEERARCIIKYIHIAVHCRRYRNFATMSQFTIALTSPEISRLSRTWDLVPGKDIQSLRELEGLISPTRNFYSLRKEMEVGGSPGPASTDVGCVPFVGIYTHDLIFNAQRPSEIASSPTTPPLVNFERCRIAASVVKTLLRLLEASNKYQFQPIEGLTERCLWMSALPDEEVRRLAESLE